MNESKWAIRKIRKGGRVKVGRKWYIPDSRHMKYDGRLDGMTYVFGRYPQCGGYLPLLHLWGTEKHFRCKDEKKSREFFHNDPQIIGEKRILPWMFWHEENTQND